jgi:Pyruvate/2-oxoacid:ferredoxin oxidoreductase delta subunit
MSNASTYTHLIIYYFSGTGNAKRSAEWIAEAGRKHKMDVHLVSIDRFDAIEIPALKGRALFGFCSPTHGFNMPPIMLRFLAKLPKLDGHDAFILNTRAGMKLYKAYLPGLSGIAQYLPALMLISKGFKIVGMQPVDLPSNWLILHPGLRNKVVISLFKKHKRIVTEFAMRLLKGGKKYQAFWSIPFDLAIFPVSIGYYFVGRFFLSKTMFATEKCDSCMLCVKNCPVKAIKWVDERPFWTLKCESCMRCVNQCPERAIETPQGFAIFIGYLGSVVGSMIFSGWMVKYNILGVNGNSWWAETVSFTIISILMVLFIFFGYRMVHYLMQYKGFSRFIGLISLSRFKWWRRYRPGRVLKESAVNPVI